MPKQRLRAALERTLIGLAVISLFTGLAALSFSKELSRENRALLILASSVGMLTSFGGLAGVKIFWKWLRRRIWQEALSAWEESTRTAKTPSIDAVHYLSEGALRTLAMQVYSRIGYGILNRDDEEGWVRMLNPVGQLELVACKQQDKPVGIGDIHELHLEVKRVEAVKGFFWAPGGFASEAMYWKGQRPIVLADRFDIGRLIDCVLAQGSNILDQ